MFPMDLCCGLRGFVHNIFRQFACEPYLIHLKGSYNVFSILRHSGSITSYMPSLPHLTHLITKWIHLCFNQNSKIKLVRENAKNRQKTDKSQKLTNADLRSTYYSTPSTKLGPPRRTLSTLRGRRCSRRMAHSDQKMQNPNISQITKFVFYVF